MNILILYSLSKTKRTFLPALDIVMLPLIANICDQKEHNGYAKNVRLLRIGSSIMIMIVIREQKPCQKLMLIFLVRLCIF